MLPWDENSRNENVGIAMIEINRLKAGLWVVAPMFHLKHGGAIFSEVEKRPLKFRRLRPFGYTRKSSTPKYPLI